MPQRRARSNRASLPLDVTPLEGRTLLANGPVPVVEAGASAYVAQLYYDLLDRAPTAEELSQGIQRVDRDSDGAFDQVNRAITVNQLRQFRTGDAGFVALAEELIDSREYRATIVRSLYQRYLERAPEPSGLEFWVDRLGDDQDRLYSDAISQVQVGILTSPEYFITQAGNDLPSYVRSLYTDVLGRGVDPQWTTWLQQLESGTSIRDVTAGIVDSREADQVQLEDHYNRFLNRPLGPEGRAYWTDVLQSGVSPYRVVREIVTSPEYVNLSTPGSIGLVDTLLARPEYSSLANALQATGLIDTLNTSGPYTVFAPTNAAFARLGNPNLSTDELRNLLSYHVVAGDLAPAQLARMGVVTTLQGQSLAFNGADDGGFEVNGNRVLAPGVRAVNGTIYGLDSVLEIPSRTIRGMINSDPNYTILSQILANAGGGTLDAAALGGPYTFFAPTDAAFNATDFGTWGSLLQPTNQLQANQFINNSTIGGAYPTQQLYGFGQRPSLFGSNLGFSRVGSQYYVNGIGITPANRIASNGFLQGIGTPFFPTFGF